MEFVCRRCTLITRQKPYRVITEDSAGILLNMLVCPSCARLAKRLGLPTLKIESAKAANTQGVQPLTDRKQQPVQRRSSML
jgi:hypothetical protein